MTSLAPLEAGSVTLVGGGPGDPGLITVAGRAALEQADVVLVDHLAPIEALAWARPDADVVDVAKLPRAGFTPQERINDLLIAHARAGRRVVRLKGGDNFVFGRGMEEVLACAQAGVPTRIVPGVSSAVAVPALAGIPLTHRGVVHGFSVISGHVPPSDPSCGLDYGALASAGTTLVVLMGVANLGAIADELVARGLAPATPAAVIARGGHPDQQVRTAPVNRIGEVATGIAPPAVTVIGEVARFAAPATTPSVAVTAVPPVLEEIS